MKRFSYLAKNSKGEVTKGEIEAENQKAAAEAIENQSLTPISVKEAEGKGNLMKKLGEIGTIPSSEKVMF
jgi:type II secretory pathway component PulF